MGLEMTNSFNLGNQNSREIENFENELKDVEEESGKDEKEWIEFEEMESG